MLLTAISLIKVILISHGHGDCHICSSLIIGQVLCLPFPTPRRHGKIDMVLSEAVNVVIFILLNKLTKKEHSVFPER
jgi:hypothetical protein